MCGSAIILPTRFSCFYRGYMEFIEGGINTYFCFLVIGKNQFSSWRRLRINQLLHDTRNTIDKQTIIGLHVVY